MIISTYHKLHLPVEVLDKQLKCSYSTKDSSQQHLRQHLRHIPKKMPNGIHKMPPQQQPVLLPQPVVVQYKKMYLSTLEAKQLDVLSYYGIMSHHYHSELCQQLQVMLQKLLLKQQLIMEEQQMNQEMMWKKTCNVLQEVQPALKKQLLQIVVLHEVQLLLSGNGVMKRQNSVGAPEY